MSVDRSRIARLISSAKSVDAATLNPSDSDQIRQTVMRKMVADMVKRSNERSVLVIAVEM